jgi:hypothetical protein
MESEPSFTCSPPHSPGSCVPLGQCREYGRQPIQIQQPAHQVGFVPDLQDPTPLKAPEAVPAFRLAPQFFNLLPGPLREAVARSEWPERAVPVENRRATGLGIQRLAKLPNPSRVDQRSNLPHRMIGGHILF